MSVGVGSEVSFLGMYVILVFVWVFGFWWCYWCVGYIYVVYWVLIIEWKIVCVDIRDMRGMVVFWGLVWEGWVVVFKRFVYIWGFCSCGVMRDGWVYWKVVCWVRVRVEGWVGSFVEWRRGIVFVGGFIRSSCYFDIEWGWEVKGYRLECVYFGILRVIVGDDVVFFCLVWRLL